MLKFVLIVGMLLASLEAESVPASYASSSIVIGADSNICGISIPNQPSKKPGLIVWLHGGMRSAKKDKGLEAHKPLMVFLKQPNNYYLASPSAFAGQDWLSAEGIAHIDQCIQYMLEKYQLDKKNINLVGVSDGSLGVLRYALDGKFSISRHVLFSSYPQITLDDKKQGAAKIFKQGKWFFFQGGKDRLFPVQEVMPLLKDWESNYSNVKLFYYPEGEHDFSFYANNSRKEIEALFP